MRQCTSARSDWPGRRREARLGMSPPVLISATWTSACDARPGLTTNAETEICPALRRAPRRYVPTKSSQTAVEPTQLALDHLDRVGDCVLAGAGGLNHGGRGP